MSKWIKISDKLPPPNKMVLTAKANKIRIALYDPTTKAFIIRSGYYFGVTHWQPLPELPKYVLYKEGHHPLTIRRTADGGYEYLEYVNPSSREEYWRKLLLSNKAIEAQIEKYKKVDGAVCEECGIYFTSEFCPCRRRAQMYRYYFTDSEDDKGCCCG